MLLNHTGNSDNSYLYAGEQFDSTLDQYYLRARYYNQGIGRFTQQDTYQGRGNEPITLHKYLYANADPVNYTDPSGQIGIAQSGITLNISSTLQAISSSVSSAVIRKTFKNLITAVGGAAIGTTGYYAVVTAQARRDSQDELRSSILAAAGTAQGRILFHYSRSIGIAGIRACSCIMASRAFDHPDGIPRPSGAYATNIPPWIHNMTQWALRNKIFSAAPHKRVVTNYVAFVKDPGWMPLIGPEWVKKAPAGTPIPIKIISVGLNPMGDR